ncbi:MAG: YceI family protein [Flavobacteriaceae bacterium]|nr:YceI family protein [Flavobacteriaceae bacterium]
MKNIIYLSILTILLFTVSCKKEKQSTPEKNTAIKNYIIDTKNSVVNWTAYKTTEKIPVKGVFKEVIITNKKPAEKPADLLDGLEFEIPVSSIFSNDSIRDYKLVNYFFGIMKNTLKLKGTINAGTNGKGIINITMNGLSENMPFTYEIQGQNIDIKSVMNLDNWQAQAAIEALNSVCNEKHKAADGISKTWNDVALDIKLKTITK